MIDGSVIDEDFTRTKRIPHFLENVPYRWNVLEIADQDLGITCCGCWIGFKVHALTGGTAPGSHWIPGCGNVIGGP